jgi:signal transduction histidine kinase
MSFKLTYATVTDDPCFLFMANSVLQHPWLKRQSKWTRSALRAVQKIWSTIIHPQPISLEYRKWRDRLIWQRYWLGLGLAIAFVSIQGVALFYEMFVEPEDFLKYLEVHKRTHLLELYHQDFFLRHGLLIGLLSLLILCRNNAWVRRHPALLVVLFPWAIAFIPEMILGAFLGIPYTPSIIMFMGQAAILPVYWRLHLVAQIVPLAFFFVVYPLIGLGTFGGHSIYSSSFTVQLILVCIICEVGVYLYEQSKQSELEANRRLKLCIHSITHDLRTPVMGSLMLLRSIQSSTPAYEPILISQTEMKQLIHGGDRLLGIMNSFINPQTFSEIDLVLNCQPTQLDAIVTTVLQDFHSDLVKQNIQINNKISANLPLVEVDVQQIERVFNNLIGNAISHNPSGLLLTLDAVQIKAERSRPMLKVSVQDDGIGIPSVQKETIFEPYTRGQQTQYLPGLGLGLYICRQVIQAHGGTIGIDSLSKGTLFWFTLPLTKI